MQASLINAIRDVGIGYKSSTKRCIISSAWVCPGHLRWVLIGIQKSPCRVCLYTGGAGAGMLGMEENVPGGRNYMTKSLDVKRTGVQKSAELLWLSGGGFGVGSLRMDSQVQAESREA